MVESGITVYTCLFFNRIAHLIVISIILGYTRGTVLSFLLDLRLNKFLLFIRKSCNLNLNGLLLLIYVIFDIFIKKFVRLFVNFLLHYNHLLL
jgi:hypothetical protein